MKEPRWLSRSVVGIIHTDQIREHGGTFGAREEGLIESGLGRPRNKWANDQGGDLADLAAAYGYGLVTNYGFVDGNKRVAFMAVYTFLGINDYELDVSEPEVVRIMLDLAASNLTESRFAAWIRERWTPLQV